MENITWKLVLGPFEFSKKSPIKGIWGGMCADLDKF